MFYVAPTPIRWSTNVINAVQLSIINYIFNGFRFSLYRDGSGMYYVYWHDTSSPVPLNDGKLTNDLSSCLSWSNRERGTGFHSAAI